MFTATGSTFFKSDLPALPPVIGDHATGMKVLMEDAVKRQSDKTLSASDLTADFANGQWFIKRRDGRSFVYTRDSNTLIYTNADITKLWNTTSQETIQRNLSVITQRQAEAQSAAEARATIKGIKPKRSQ
jgi:hypothetical protein